MAKPTKPEPFSVLAGLRETFTGIDPAIRLNRVWSCCLEDIVDLYRPVCEANDDADLLKSSTRLAAVYVKALGDVPDEALRAAWARVMATHKLKRWPTIDEIRAHLSKTTRAVAPTGSSRVRAATIEEQKILREIGFESLTQVRDEDMDRYREMHRTRLERSAARGYAEGNA